MYSLRRRTIVWIYANHLALNLPKSSLLIFLRSGTSCPSVQTISTTRCDINRAPDGQSQFLGILFDKNLYFKHHFSLEKFNFSRSLIAVQKVCYCFPGLIIKVLFHSLIQSDMYCCPAVWLSTLSSFTLPILKTCNRAIKLVSEVTGPISMN